MRYAIILASFAAIAFTNVAQAAPKATIECGTDADCQAKNGGDGYNEPKAKKPRDTTVIKACGVEWKAAKADEAVKAAGWPAFWHLCSLRSKAAKN